MIPRTHVHNLKHFYTHRLRPSLNVHFNTRKLSILGIETSCDDTGAAVVNENGTILGECINSQQQIHLNHGGIIPPIAQDLHRQHIESVVQKSLESSRLTFEDLDAIAVTVKPGLPLSLLIGMKYAKYLSRTYQKPLIPIHHMEAHALTARMVDKTIAFPFLVLLISGGHCLLAYAADADDFHLLGHSIDDAPGEAFDKTARRMKLHTMEPYRSVCGGRAIELAASQAHDPIKYAFTTPLLRYRDCNFSFSGIKNIAQRLIVKLERENDVEPDQVIHDYENVCGAFQLAVTRHLCHRVQRAIEFLDGAQLPHTRVLVVSGGTACNDYIFNGLQLVTDHFHYRIVRPTRNLCTDNGIMIAWNGVEKWRLNRGIFPVDQLDRVDIAGKAPFGRDMSERVVDAAIKCDWVSIKTLFRK